MKKAEKRENKKKKKKWENKKLSDEEKWQQNHCYGARIHCTRTYIFEDVNLYLNNI